MQDYALMTPESAEDKFYSFSEMHDSSKIRLFDKALEERGF